ncbi:hypothetical protein ES703_34965 [subsurface metagenome]
MKRACAFLILLGFLVITSPVALAQEDMGDYPPKGNPTTTAIEGDPMDYLRIVLPSGWIWAVSPTLDEVTISGIPVRYAGGVVINEEIEEAVFLVVYLTETPPEMSTLLREWVDFLAWFGWSVTREGFLGDESWELSGYGPSDFGPIRSIVVWRRGEIGAWLQGSSKTSVYIFVELIDEQMQPKIDWTPFLALALMSGVVGLVWAYSAKRWRVKA